VFSLTTIALFSFMIWSEGFRTARDLFGFLLVVIISTSSGLAFSLVTWRTSRLGSAEQQVAGQCWKAVNFRRQAEPNAVRDYGSGSGFVSY
jgi:hypothetical protein